MLLQRFLTNFIWLFCFPVAKSP